jgi:hypothetical protein
MAARDKSSESLGAFFTDIRQKVVEEAWFGRAATTDFRDSDQQATGNRTVTEPALLHRTAIPETNKHSIAAPERSFADQLGWNRRSGRDDPKHEPDYGMDH